MGPVPKYVPTIYWVRSSINIAYQSENFVDQLTNEIERGILKKGRSESAIQTLFRNNEQSYC